jgi:SAM-dependent methyltransferase
MSQDERARWDERYADGDWADIDEPAKILEEAEAWLEPPGLALDVACGAGRNSLQLARRGFTVVSVDISWNGLQRLAHRASDDELPIYPIHADLERFVLPEATFDVIVNTRFLLRSLFFEFRKALKPGGLLVFESFNVEEIETLGGDIRREYALERGELLEAFSDFEILLYEEGVFEKREGERGLARFIGRKAISNTAHRTPHSESGTATQ